MISVPVPPHSNASPSTNFARESICFRYSIQYSLPHCYLVSSTTGRIQFMGRLSTWRFKCIRMRLAHRSTASRRLGVVNRFGITPTSWAASPVGKEVVLEMLIVAVFRMVVRPKGISIASCLEFGPNATRCLDLRPQLHPICCLYPEDLPCGIL